MTRQASIGMMRSRTGPTPKDLPGEGTQLRFVYDILYEHRGRVVPKEEWEAVKALLDGEKTPKRIRNRTSTLVNNLRDFYGCDIRFMGKFGIREKGHGYMRPILVGEWAGKDYKDYVLERVNEGDSTR